MTDPSAHFSVVKPSSFPFENHEEFKAALSANKSSALSPQTVPVLLWCLGDWEFDAPVQATATTIVLITFCAFLVLVWVTTLQTAFVSAPSSSQVASLLILLACAWLSRRVWLVTTKRLFVERLVSDEQFCYYAWNRHSFRLKEHKSRQVAAAQDKSHPKPPACDEATIPASDPVSTLAGADESNQIAVLPMPEIDEKLARSIESRAMNFVIEYERACGRTVEDVSNLNVGYDLESSDSYETRCIEVKGKNNKGTVILTLNEWRAAHHHQESYFLYVVEEIFTAEPKLKTIRNPAEHIEPRPHRYQYILHRSLYIAKSVAIWPVEQ